MKRRIIGRKVVKNQRQLVQAFGKVAGLYTSKLGVTFFAWYMPFPGAFPGTLSESNLRMVDVRSMRLKLLREATIQATEAHEKGELTLGDLETVQDYLFAEMNQRMNKKGLIHA